MGVDDRIEAYTPLVDISFAKFNAEKLPEAEQVQVRYTNIDFAGHTNNKEYFRFVLNTYSVQKLEASPIREMDVVYLNQSYENDMLTIHKGSFQGKDIFALQKECQTIVRCEIVCGSQSGGRAKSDRRCPADARL